MRISVWSADVCASDLREIPLAHDHRVLVQHRAGVGEVAGVVPGLDVDAGLRAGEHRLDEAGRERLRPLGERQDGGVEAEPLTLLLGRRLVNPQIRSANAWTPVANAYHVSRLLAANTKTLTPSDITTAI